MKRVIHITLPVLLALSVIQCSSENIKTTNIKNNRKLIAEAYNDKKLIIFNSRTSSKGNSNNIVAGFVTFVDNTGDRFHFKDLKSKDPILLSVKYDIESVSYFNNEEKIRISLLDNSVFIGTIAGANITDNSIVFATQHKKYTIPCSKINDIKFFDFTHVKLVFLDGSEIFGSIVKDDGESIFITTILGDDSYPRNDILRIDYIK